VLRHAIEWTAAWAYTTPVAAWVRGSAWAVPTLSVLHLFGLILLLGSIFMIALRCFGFAWRRDGAGSVVRTFAPATLVGLAMMICSGSLLFAAGADRYVESASFEYKMVALAVAVAVQSVVYVAAARDTEPPDRVVSAKWVAIGGLMFVLWLTVAVFGRFIAFY
jgi:hypothetical protein